MNIEPLESRIAPATVTFADVDGDFVTIKTSKGTDGELNAILTLMPSGLGMEIREIDFSANAAVFFGTNLTVTAKRTSAGGDGHVNVVYIDAIAGTDGTALNLGNVRISGDLGRIQAGTSSATVPAVKSLTVQSVGEFNTGGAAQVSDFNGALGILVVAGNIRNANIDAHGTPFGKIGSVTIGGSLIGGAPSSGQITSDVAIGSVKIGVNLEGGGGADSGVIDAPVLSAVTIGGSLFGRSGSSAQILGDSIGLVKIGGDVRGGGSSSGLILADSLAGLTVGGSIIAGTAASGFTLFDSGAVRIEGPIGKILIKGSIIGNSTHRVAITALGTPTSTAVSDVAIKSLTVLGRVETANILAGFDTMDPPRALNADAQIGPVIVGDWFASNLVAGAQDDATAAFDTTFGDANDQKITDPNNAANVASRIASIFIKGTARGTVGGSDQFGFVAQQIGSFKIGATSFPLVLGAANALDITGYAVGITGDLRVREVGI